MHWRNLEEIERLVIERLPFYIGAVSTGRILFKLPLIKTYVELMLFAAF